MEVIPRFSPGSQTEMPLREKSTPEKGRLAQVLWEQPGNPALCRVVGPQKGSLMPKDSVIMGSFLPRLDPHFCPIPKLICFLKLYGDRDLSASKRAPCANPEPIPGPGEEKLAVLRVILMYRWRRGGDGQKGNGK